ncbi:MAG: methylmalonyl Co-A mutase-associated GTPase MeaB [Bacteroidota bacterium]
MCRDCSKAASLPFLRPERLPGRSLRRWRACSPHLPPASNDRNLMDRNLAQLVRDASDPSAGARQVRAAARLMSFLEAEPQRLPDVFRHLPQEAWPRPRLVLGITGAPGSGKSTLVDALIAEYRHRHPGARIGAIAVDPSSPFTGGAVLGDRVRMMRHAEDPGVFIRSLASRGHLGGLSLGVRGVLRIMGLTGCELVIIETVGVGQSEVEVAGVADQVLVILAPGQGDSIQMLKAGLLEIADLFAVNKADTPGADRLHSSLINTIGLGYVSDNPIKEDVKGEFPQRKRETPEVFLVSATEKSGIEELVDALEQRTESRSSEWQTFRDASVVAEVRDAVLEEGRLRLLDLLNNNGTAGQELQKVLAGDTSVREFTQQLFEKVRAGSRSGT